MTDPKPMTPAAKLRPEEQNPQSMDDVFPSVARIREMTGNATPLQERVTAYLTGGGLFNPELANHDAVRTLVTDLLEAVERLTQDRERMDWLEATGTFVSRMNAPYENGMEWCASWPSEVSPTGHEAEGATAREAIDAARRPSPEDTKS